MSTAGERKWQALDELSVGRRGEAEVMLRERWLTFC